MVEDNQKQNKASFQVLKKADPLTINKRNSYFISLQEIKQEGSGSVSNHLVIKKQPLNEDGSPRGASRQVFIPEGDVVQLMKHIADFVEKNKKQ